MKSLLIAFLLLLLKKGVQSSANFNYDLNFNMLRLRNSYLRLRLSDNVSKINRCYKKIHAKLVSRYYDLSSDYYSLSDEDRLLIETVISLSY